MASKNFSLARQHTSYVWTRVSVLGLALTFLISHSSTVASKEQATMWMTVDAQRFAVTLDVFFGHPWGI